MSTQPVPQFSRNLLWLQPELTDQIANSKLSIIGCGGNGVVFSIYAAHVGFSNLALCDGDILEETNLNRYIIASRRDVGKLKTEIIKSYILSRFGQATVNCIGEHFPNNRIAEHIEASTAVIGCVDNVQARIELDVLCRKFGKTLIDLGSGFVKNDSNTGMHQIVGAGGQVLVSRPTGACLRCLGFDLEAASNTYFLPDSLVPEPSSLLLNGIIGSLAMECLLMEMAGRLRLTNRISYNRGSLAIEMESLTGPSGCQICGPDALNHIYSVACGEELRRILIEEGVHCRT